MKTTLALAAAFALALPIGTSAAGDVQGDAYGCQELWVMRNQVYKDAGYCFKTARAIGYFGNGGCAYANEASVPLSQVERRFIHDIRRSERRQGC